MLSSGSPIMLLCLARPDLSDRRPRWPVALRLEPLAEEDADQLIPEAASGELRQRIGRAAGGNPLFLTEMVAMARDSGGRVAVPPNLQALLAARLDQLDADERSVLERGAVEGEIFHRGADQALSPQGVRMQLVTLVRKQLIHRDQAQIPGEDAFRFHHLLIRDVAYESLPKATRAESHVRLAAWLEERARLVELDEIVGYHLEQASRYQQELGRPDAALAARASERLAAAGRRAIRRNDYRSAIGLLERAVEPIRSERLDVALEMDLALALGLGDDLRRGVEVAEAVAERARAAGDRAGESVARLGAARRHLALGETGLDDVEALARAALPLVEEADDHAGQMRVWRALGDVANYHGRFEEVIRAAEKEFHHSQLVGGSATPASLAWALALGPRPADEALRTLDTLPIEATDPETLMVRAWLLAMLTRFDQAWPLARQASSRLAERIGWGTANLTLADLATLEGDHETAAHYRYQQCHWNETQGYRSALANAAPDLGRSLCALERYGEAERWAKLGVELCDEHDMYPQARSRQVQAVVDAHRGRHGGAEALAREAAAILENTDMLSVQADALCDLGKVLQTAGKTTEAAAAFDEALDRYRRKKNLAMVVQVRPLLDGLREEAVARTKR